MNNVMMLVKIARDNRDDNSGKKALAAGALAAATGNASKSRVLGYHTVNHGTSNKNARAVKRSGALKPSKGGSVGGATESLKNTEARDAYRPRVKGKVHVTKSPLHARVFAHMAESGEGGVTKGKLLRGKMSHNQWRKSVVDADVAGPTGPKSIAATTTHRVKVDNSQKFATKKNLKRYLSSGSGKKRFASGLRLAAVSTGAALYGAKKLADKARDNKKS